MNAESIKNTHESIPLNKKSYIFITNLEVPECPSYRTNQQSRFNFLPNIENLDY